MTIREFVKKSFEYDHYRKHGAWGKYTVYHVWNKEWEGAKIGFPHFALVDGENIEKLFLEFDNHKTKEANFAYQCDKLECDLQCKLYDEE